MFRAASVRRHRRVGLARQLPAPPQIRTLITSIPSYGRRPRPGETFAVVPHSRIRPVLLEWEQYAKSCRAAALSGRGLRKSGAAARCQICRTFLLRYIDRGKTCNRGGAGLRSDRPAAVTTFYSGSTSGFRLHPADIWGSWLRAGHGDRVRREPLSSKYSTYSKTLTSSAPVKIFEGQRRERRGFGETWHQ